MTKFKCPRCSGEEFVRDQKSLRCSNKECMYHLSREEKQKFLSARRRTRKALTTDQLRDSKRTSHYAAIGVKNGSLTLKQAAKLKGTSVSIIYCHLSRLNTTRKPLRIKYDSKLINLRIHGRQRLAKY